MARRPLSLDLDALRSFELGMTLGSFALAAERLCRSTSAVSAQLKKLERQCGAPLLLKEGRHLHLTEHGEILMGYAKRLLALNDEALEAAEIQHLSGHIRLGMQEDFGETLLPDVLGRFVRAHPDVQITACIERNQRLRQEIDKGLLDLALCWHDVHTMPETSVLTTLPLQWIYHADMSIQSCLEQQKPLPLVLFEAPCLMRQLALAALDEAGISWRIAFTSRSLGGIWAAVNAGLGATVRSTIGMPSTLAMDTQGVLPALPALGIGLLQSLPRLPEAAVRLKAILGDVLRDMKKI